MIEILEKSKLKCECQLLEFLKFHKLTRTKCYNTMGCNSSKTIPNVEDSDDEPYEPSKDLFENDTGVINPSAAVADIQPDITTKPKEEASKEETPTTSIPSISTATAIPAEEKKQETDAEFLQRMEDEDKASFTAAVNEWRADKAAGKGEAKIIESGGGFGATSTETTDSQVDEKQSEPVSKTEETKVETSSENNDVPVKESKDENEDDSKVDVKEETKEETKEVAKEEAKEETKEGTEEETKEENTDSKDEDMGFGIAGLLPFAIAQEMIPTDSEW
jgi:hypothetical protein